MIKIYLPGWKCVPLIFLIFLQSCNSAELSPDSRVDSTASVTEDSMAVATTPGSKSDSGFILKPSPKPATPGKSAILGYSHPERLRRNEVKNINVFLTVSLPESKIRDTLKKIIRSQQRVIRENDTTHILTEENLILYNEVEVQLIDPGKIFTITPIASEKQTVDTINGNRWRWAITTSTDKAYGDLILKVTVKNPNTEPVRLEDHNFQISIDIDPPTSLLRRSWLYLLDNPAIVVTVILIPLIAFFGKRYFDQRDKKGKT